MTAQLSDERCGTYAGWNFHRRQGTPICDGCRKAHTDYLREYRRGNPERRARDGVYNRARGKALTQLAARHPADYLRLLDAALERERAVA